MANLTDRGCLVDPQAAAHIAQQPQPEVYLEDVLRRLPELPFLLTLNDLTGAMTSMPRPAPFPTETLELPPSLRGVGAVLRTSVTAGPEPTSSMGRPLAAQVESEIRILKDSSQTAATSGDARDFVRYFNDRVESLTRLLRQRREVANAVRIRDVGKVGRDVQIIGLIKEKVRTPSGHRFLTLEDNTGEVEVFVPRDKPELAGQFDSLLPDEVVGIVGQPARDGGALFVESILRPDVPYLGERPRPEEPLYAAFVGDVHMGSKTFLEREFRSLVRWLHGDEGSARERAVARGLKYLVFPGDLVDGVGVYPGQQEALAIEEVYKQYETLARELQELPNHVHLVFLPGNHDASRPTEPQPALSRDLHGLFDAHETTFVSNPSFFSLHGVQILGYHGVSMVDFATSVPGLRMDQPGPVMKQMLQCRHLAPTYGGKTPISPDEHDFLVIDHIPDVFVTGHVHVADLSRYKNIVLVNAGTWQAQTDYQRTQNLVPTPARLPVVNLKTLASSMIDFSGAA